MWILCQARNNIFHSVFLTKYDIRTTQYEKTPEVGVEHSPCCQVRDFESVFKANFTTLKDSGFLSEVYLIQVF